jgi:ATPase subunit of ABC transporter with duplicated ATPase domains
LEGKEFYLVESRIKKVMNGLGLSALGGDKLLSKLSGGQRGKIILAKLLLDEPDVLLLDEPTNFLDKE